jgi:tetratricopeptide (TPR) repeat protein
MTKETARAALTALFATAQGHLREGRLEEAERVLGRILRQAPDHPHALYALGLLRHRQGRSGEAVALLERAMPALDRDPVACFNMATVLLEQGRADEAADALRRALALRPGYDDAELQLGVACVRGGRPDAAIAAFEAVLARTPGHLVALMNLAGVLASHRPGEAVAYAERAVAAAPQARKVPALNLLAKALAMSGREDEAVAAYDEALKLAPDDLRARFGTAVTLPRVYAEQAGIDRWRARYTRELADFDAWLKLETKAEIEAAAESVFTLGNFPLPQQGRDDRAVQEVYGRLLHRVAAARYPDYARPLTLTARDGRPRVGFVSAFFRAHSIAKTHGAWARRLDRESFEVFAVHTGTEADEVSEGFRRDCEHFVHHPRADAALLRLLEGLDLDVLVYPDLGMEPAMLLPAALRLAPVQCQRRGAL